MRRFIRSPFFSLACCLLLLAFCQAAAQAQVTYYEIVARHSGKCLDVSGGSYDNGALLHQWDCLGIPNQHWQITEVGGGYYRLTAQHSGKVADVAGGYLDNGTPIHQWDYVGIPNQQWALIDT